MALERVWKGLLVLAVVAAAGIVLVQAGLVSVPWGPDEGEVRILDDGSDDDPSADADPESDTGGAPRVKRRTEAMGVMATLNANPRPSLMLKSQTIQTNVTPD